MYQCHNAMHQSFDQILHHTQSDGQHIDGQTSAASAGNTLATQQSHSIHPLNLPYQHNSPTDNPTYLF